VKPIPDGFRAVTPYLVQECVAGLIGFLKAAFGAEEIERQGVPDGRVMLAEVLLEPADMFYGGRNAGVSDASGMQWWIGPHIEEVTPEDMERRMAAQG